MHSHLLSTDRRIRYALLGLAALSNVGIGLELIVSRHWGTRIQLVPWAMIVLTLASIALIWPVHARWRTHVARVVSAIVAGAAGLGVYEHVRSNYQTAPLQSRFAEKWSTMSTISKVWEAATGGVRQGSPPLAPSAMMVAAILVWIATVSSWDLSRRTLTPSAHPPEVELSTG